MGQFDFVRMALMPKWHPQGFAKTAGMEDEPEQGRVSIGGTGVDTRVTAGTPGNRL